MAKIVHHRRRFLICLVASCLFLAVVGGYLIWSLRLPAPGSEVYEQFVDAFQVGVASLDAGLPQVAEEYLTRAIELVPTEPAAWANRGLLYLRTERLDEAAEDLEQAERLAPDDAAIQKLLGLLAQRRGQFGEAVSHLRRALARESNDIRALYFLAQVIDQEQSEGSDNERRRLMEQIIEIRPTNLYVLVDRLRNAARRTDTDAVHDTIKRLKQLAPGWSESTREALAELDKELTDPLVPEAMLSVQRFCNLLQGEPAFPRTAAEVSPPNSLPGDSLQTFLRLTPVKHSPAPIDTELTFTPEPWATSLGSGWDVVLSAWLTGEGEPSVFVANSRELRNVGNETALTSFPLSNRGVIALDWNNDLQSDFLLAGTAGLRFYEQNEAGVFVDTTTKSGLDDMILAGDYDGVFAADVDLEGDVDLLVARRIGSPLLLRNNFDGTFTPQAIFTDVDGPQVFSWADFDHDGVPDAAMLDAKGQLRVFANQRMTEFQPWPVLPPVDRFLAFTVADVNDDGVLDIITLRDDGSLSAMSDVDKRSAWKITELGRWSAISREHPTTINLMLAADIDNNGALDLLVSGPDKSSLWLGSGGGKYLPLRGNLPSRLFAATDLSGDGRIDLLGLDADGRPLHLRNNGRKNYHWQMVRPRAVQARLEGDNRINSYGIGGEIELRTGTHVAKQMISAPAVHFGLGQRSRSDVLRIVWPNGTSQIELNPPIDQIINAVQRLKGSCPFLFAWNGHHFNFVSDFMWSTPLGMYINASDKGGFSQTKDWVKIPGELIVASDGQYNLRVNANLWETHYIDHVAMLVVDHPPDTEMFVDERFHMQPTAPAFHLMEKPRSVAGAWDHHGRDAFAELQSIDAVYLDRSDRSAYQGIAHDHWVEVELGENAPTDGPLWLLAYGWVHPTDSSINYAIEQGKNEPPRGLVLEVPDGQGGWKVARDRLGFPAGKNKTVLIRLDGIDGSSIPRRIRLRTNMEIYWDAIQYARGRNETQVTQQLLLPYRADLQFRGIVAMTQANSSSPEIPQYDQVVSRSQVWRDLIGYYTRFGDIRELLQHVDDRYAILSAGDEIVLQFEATVEPPPGWKRDFVWIADGWVKDGDYNTRFGKTVLPLPAHDFESYRDPPGRLEDDPVYRRHAKDWDVYHTRYVTPHEYERGLRSFSNSSKQSD